MNFAAKIVSGVEHEVEVKIGELGGAINLSVVSMDDLQLVLELEFFDMVCAFLIPFANSLCILDDRRTCMVSTERGTNNTTKTLSAIQFKNSFNIHELCYLAVIKKELEGLSSTEEVPMEIKQFSKELQDVMPKELPKKLPQRR